VDQPTLTQARTLVYAEECNLYQYYWDARGWRPADVDRHLTPRERVFFYRQALERRKQELDELELTFRRGFGAEDKRWLSQFYQLLFESSAKQQRVFPYDVPYLTSTEVYQLVQLSKQLYFDEACLLMLQDTLPADVFQQIQPLKSCKFFEEEFWPELEKLLGIVQARQYGEILLQAGKTFSKQDVPQWTEDRARAHLQDADPVLKRASVHPRLWEILLAYRKRGKPMTQVALQRWIDIVRLETTLEQPAWFPGENWEAHLKTCGVNLEQVKQAHYDLLKEAQRDL
jgi:hypothetical protein